MFNDLDHENVASLQAAIEAIPEVKKLKHQPRVYNHEVGTEIAKQFESMKMIPTFFFVDPWGYKGLSLKLINSVLQNWGCDCVFFFNYNRISMGLNNELVKAHMNALFGQNRADALRARLGKLSGDQKEVTIIEELSNALREMGGRYVLPFRFRNAAGNRTTHHLIFVSILMKTEEYYMGIAIAVREKANCLGRKVGAVLVKENRIISTGYNGTPEGVENCLDGGCVRCARKEQFAPSVGYDVCVCVHAEENALITAARFGISVEGATAYSTMRPCFTCTRALLQAKIQEVFYLHDWRHPEDVLKDQYELLQARFPHRVKKLSMQDSRAKWANTGTQLKLAAQASDGAPKRILRRQERDNAKRRKSH